VAVAVLLKLEPQVQVEAPLAILEPLEQVVLLGQTLVQAEQIQVAVQAQQIPLTQAQVEMVALEL
jgi:hypothetical protein